MVSVLEQLKDLFMFVYCESCELGFAMLISLRNGEWIFGSVEQFPIGKAYVPIIQERNRGREFSVVLSGKLFKQFETGVDSTFSDNPIGEKAAAEVRRYYYADRTSTALETLIRPSLRATVKQSYANLQKLRDWPIFTTFVLAMTGLIGGFAYDKY